MGDDFNEGINDWIKWYHWFAWRPVKIDGKWHWFKMIYRKPIPKTWVTMEDWQKYEYGTIFHVMKDQGYA